MLESSTSMQQTQTRNGKEQSVSFNCLHGSHPSLASFGSQDSKWMGPKSKPILHKQKYRQKAVCSLHKSTQKPRQYAIGGKPNNRRGGSPPRGTQTNVTSTNAKALVWPQGPGPQQQPAPPHPSGPCLLPAYGSTQTTLKYHG